MKVKSNKAIVDEYVESILSGQKIACSELKQACQRYKDDLVNPKFELGVKDPEFVINIIENAFVHAEGEALDGTPLAGKPFLLEPWQKFIIYNLVGFYYKGTHIRKYKEAFIMVPRKNGKTRFAAALAFSLGLLERKSTSRVFMVGSVLKEALQSFNFIVANIEYMGERSNFHIVDNNNAHTINRKFEEGSIYLEALVDRDSLIGNICIMDELHEYKNSIKYDRMKKAGRAYSNKLLIGITTGGHSMNSFCYNRFLYCKKIINKNPVSGNYQVDDDQYFVFITKADQNEDGSVDFLNPEIHEMASPNYRVTIRPDDIMTDARQAQDDPQTRKEFLAKDLNVYTSSLRTYFNLDTFRTSDSKYNWTLEELAKMPIDWFGGADLSKMHDLTAAALHGVYKDVDISITHAFFPITRAHLKADEDNIPLFGWEDDGWLTMANGDITNHADVVKWFEMMRERGFNIKQIGFDRKFGEEFYLMMKKARFNIVDEPQLFFNKSKGFRRIEQKAIAGKLYYLHSSAYEYCLENVHGIEKTDDAIQYEKVMPNMRIDLFDADVFATCRMIGSLEKSKTARTWLKGGN